MTTTRRVIHFDRHEDLQREFDDLLDEYTSVVFQSAAKDSIIRALKDTVAELQAIVKGTPQTIRRQGIEVH